MAYDRLIHDLGADLTPVKPLHPPLWRALGWLALVAAVAAGLALFANDAQMLRRLSGAPDLALAVVGSTATAILAAVAVFELSLPDRRPAWALLPLPAALLWIGASGMGCLRTWVAPGTHDVTMRETGDCLMYIVGLSIPLSILMVLMLRRAYSLRPGLTAAIGGLSVAAASATLLNFFHPYDAAATDLSVHAFAVGVVIIVNRLVGGRVLAKGHGAK